MAAAATRVMAAAALLAWAAACIPTRPQAGVLIFAAASLQTVLDELTPAMEDAAGVAVRTSYAGSSSLARQIERGAPADVFISADLDWMDYLQAAGSIQVDTRVVLAGNTLVLIAPASRAVALRIEPGFPLAEAIGAGRLAVGMPESVPAGRYARAALEHLGVWESVAPRIAPAENVRAALLLVARGEAPLGIVYRTDATSDDRITIVGVFPQDSHPPVVYPAAVTARGSDAARRVLEFLQGTTGRAAFARHGFGPPGS